MSNSARLHCLKTKMKEIQEAIDKDDDEVAHSREDDLHIWVLGEISKVNTLHEAQELARLALETTELEFSRWCA